MSMRKTLAGIAAAVIATAGLLVPAPAQAATGDVYSTPGVQLINDRYWQTGCSNYSATIIRCTTDIFATKVFMENGQWYKQNTWAFNNLAYLPSARQAWASNPLGNTGSWTSTDGRTWRTECDTATTGRGACRNYIVATVASEAGGVVKQEAKEVFNSMVRFSTSTVPAVTMIPAPAPYLAPPAPGPKQLLSAAVAPKPAAIAAPVTVAPAPTSGSASPNGWNCPSAYPIKGNANSMIYHMPDQRYYSRTQPEECFATRSAAEAAGYRAAKV